MAVSLALGLLACPLSAAGAGQEIKGDYVPQPKELVYEDFSYGPSKMDKVRFVASRLPQRGPVVIELAPNARFHRSQRYGTEWLPSFLFDNGFVYSYIVPRARRSATGVEHARSMALAVAEVARRADEFGYDGSRIILMGREQGGQMAALLATDLSYLAAAGVPAASIKGALILDGLALDFSSELASGSDFERKQLKELVGKSHGAEAALSPLAQAAAPNAPGFLFHAVKDDSRRLGQARALAGG